MPPITKCNTITGFPLWWNRCISLSYEIVYVKNAELGFSLLAILADQTRSLDPAHVDFLLPNSLRPGSLRVQWDMLRRQTKNYTDGTFTRESSG